MAGAIVQIPTHHHAGACTKVGADEGGSNKSWFTWDSTYSDVRKRTILGYRNSLLMPYNMVFK